MIVCVSSRKHALNPQCNPITCQYTLRLEFLVLGYPLFRKIYLEENFMDVPRLFRVLVEVADLDQAITFYSSLLGIPGRKVGGERAYFDCGQTIVGLVDVASGKHTPQAAPQDLYFAVARVEEFHARALALKCLSSENVHGQPAGDLLTRPWGERCFYAQDPWSNGLCFSDETTLFMGRDAGKGGEERA